MPIDALLLPDTPAGTTSGVSLSGLGLSGLDRPPRLALGPWNTVDDSTLPSQELSPVSSPVALSARALPLPYHLNSDLMMPGSLYSLPGCNTASLAVVHSPVPVPPRAKRSRTKALSHEPSLADLQASLVVEKALVRPPTPVEEEQRPRLWPAATRSVAEIKRDFPPGTEIVAETSEDQQGEEEGMVLIPGDTIPEQQQHPDSFSGPSSCSSKKTTTTTKKETKRKRAPSTPSNVAILQPIDWALSQNKTHFYRLLWPIWSTLTSQKVVFWSVSVEGGDFSIPYDLDSLTDWLFYDMAQKTCKRFTKYLPSQSAVDSAAPLAKTLNPDYSLSQVLSEATEFCRGAQILMSDMATHYHINLSDELSHALVSLESDILPRFCTSTPSEALQYASLIPSTETLPSTTSPRQSSLKIYTPKVEIEWVHKYLLLNPRQPPTGYFPLLDAADFGDASGTVTESLPVDLTLENQVRRMLNIFSLLQVFVSDV